MRRLNTWVSLTFSIFVLVFCLGLTKNQDTINTDEGFNECAFGPSSWCYHNFDDTTTSTTGDSGTYDVTSCSHMTYSHFAAGGSQVQVMECPTSSKNSDCHVFNGDSDGNGRVTSSEENRILTGLLGFRQITRAPVGGSHHYVNVLEPPSSGTARVFGKCEKGNK